MNPHSRAKGLRRRPTEAERKLWRILRGRRFAGYKFRRQHPMGPCVLDFYCAESRYNVELDGGGHGFPEQRKEDAERDAYLCTRNIQTRRFWNHELRNERMIADTVWNDLQGRTPHPENLPLAKPTRLPSHPQHAERPRPSPLSPQRGEG